MAEAALPAVEAEPRSQPVLQHHAWGVRPHAVGTTSKYQCNKCGVWYDPHEDQEPCPGSPIYESLDRRLEQVLDASDLAWGDT
jgi:hypothetical protein